MSKSKLGNYTATRSDLTDFVHREIGLSKWESSDLVNSVFSKIEEALLSGETVKLAGFGNFTTRNKPERVGRNPKTGESVKIPPMRVLSFKPSAKLNDRVNTALSMHRETDEE